MDETEKSVNAFLARSGHTNVVYEPDGNVPPDFLIDGRVAVEVRRLNQNEEGGAVHRGLEEVRIPLRKAIEDLLPTIGRSIGGRSWYVMLRFSRPLPPLANLKTRLRASLSALRSDPANAPKKFNVGDQFGVELTASRTFSDSFVLGGFTDRDSGGFVLSEMCRNIHICVQEKSRKVALMRSRYPEWWLCLVDHIGLGLRGQDRAKLRTLLSVEHAWDKIIVVHPEDPEGYEV